ncbi:MAG: hypothetical protein II482_02620, partial [Lachnospiraceae bacterium]|nr:hypothetical protein [Lachnospiraceae bacterium]
AAFRKLGQMLDLAFTEVDPGWYVESEIVHIKPPSYKSVSLSNLKVILLTMREIRDPVLMKDLMSLK